jgi:DNA-binding MarR family transcriptional regulator
MIESYNNTNNFICRYFFMIESHIIKPMENDKYISNLIGAFAITISSNIEQQIAELGGRSLNHEAALVAVHNHPNETIDILSKILGLTHSGAVRLINTLESEDLIERHKSVKDARAVVLRVTATGQKRVNLILASREKVVRELLENFDDKQRENFVDLLRISMKHLTSDQVEARRICRLCDEGVCRKQGCPVENITS